MHRTKLMRSAGSKRSARRATEATEATRATRAALSVYGRDLCRETLILFAKITK